MCIYGFRYLGKARHPAKIHIRIFFSNSHREGIFDSTRIISRFQKEMYPIDRFLTQCADPHLACQISIWIIIKKRSYHLLRRFAQTCGRYLEEKTSHNDPHSRLELQNLVDSRQPSCFFRFLRLFLSSSLLSSYGVGGGYCLLWIYFNNKVTLISLVSCIQFIFQ